MATDESWVKGLRAEKALEKDLGVCLNWWPTLIPELSSGAVKVRCQRAVISDLVHEGMRMNTKPAEERASWVIPAPAWDTVDRGSLGSGLSNIEGFFEYVRLDETTDLRFLDRTDRVMVSASGLEFERLGLVDCFDLSADAQAILGGRAPEPAPAIEKNKGSARSNSGRKPDVVRWEKFAAALAVLFERGELDLTSENKAHEQIASFLVERGHEDALGVDTVRSLLRRVRAWNDGNPFPDDHDYPDG